MALLLITSNGWEIEGTGIIIQKFKFGWAYMDGQNHLLTSNAQDLCTLQNRFFPSRKKLVDFLNLLRMEKGLPRFQNARFVKPQNRTFLETQTACIVTKQNKFWVLHSSTEKRRFASQAKLLSYVKNQFDSGAGGKNKPW